MNTENERIPISKVEQLTGVPRTKIRYYMDKGLLDVRRDDQSGYYSYSYRDLIRICQIVYYREKLGFSVEKVEQLFKANEIELIEPIVNEQLAYLESEISLLDSQYSMMSFNRKMVQRQLKYEDRIILNPFGVAYVVPYDYYFLTNHEVYPIMYGASEFSFNKKGISHLKKCCLVFEEDAKYIDQNVFDKFCADVERIEIGMCIYSVTLSSKNANDPSLLQPALNWANEHHFRITGRIFTKYFFPYYSDDTPYGYIELYMPIDV
jgi:DNA-binding transcriptional MerR regulator